MYKGQVWMEKSYVELCNQNILSILYDPYIDEVTRKYPQTLEMTNDLNVPPAPGHGFIFDDTQIPYDSEILQSFAELTKATFLMITSLNDYGENANEDLWQVLVGSYQYHVKDSIHEQDLSPTNYYSWYIWTKDGIRI